jgi:hypothetical protein
MMRTQPPTLRASSAAISSTLSVSVRQPKPLDHADARHVHAEYLRQHQVHVVRHLGRGVHGDAVAHHVVVGDRGVHLHLVLAHLGAIVGAFANQVG